jgi:hypothetical protein
MCHKLTSLGFSSGACSIGVAVGRTCRQVVAPTGLDLHSTVHVSAANLTKRYLCSEIGRRISCRHLASLRKAYAGALLGQSLCHDRFLCQGICRRAAHYKDCVHAPSLGQAYPSRPWVAVVGSLGPCEVGRHPQQRGWQHTSVELVCSH